MTGLVKRLDGVAVRVLQHRVGHWRPRYVYDRFGQLAFRGLHADAPWLTADAVRMLDRYLRPDQRGLEYGSGRSTTWLARRSGSLRSVETDRTWFERVSAQAREAGLENLELRLVELDVASADRSAVQAYVEAGGVEPESLDYALVDGHFRDLCAIHVIPMLKPGAVLIWDNSNWMLPHPTRSPYSTLVPVTPDAERFLEAVSGWQRVFTTDGVTDTTLWFKPRG